VAVSRRNIGHVLAKIGRDSRHLDRFGTGTENPRVGGSIPPLATIQIEASVKNDAYVECPISISWHVRGASLRRYV